MNWNFKIFIQTSWNYDWSFLLVRCWQKWQHWPKTSWHSGENASLNFPNERTRLRGAPVRVSSKKFCFCISFVQSVSQSANLSLISPFAFIHSEQAQTEMANAVIRNEQALREEFHIFINTIILQREKYTNKLYWKF